MTETLKESEFQIEQGYFDRPYNGIGSENEDAKLVRKHVDNKRQAYRDRFGGNYHHEDDALLPISVYRQELEWAKFSLSSDSKDVKAKMLCVENRDDLVYGFEIEIDGRRFAIPKDTFVKISAGAAGEEINSAVVSILNENSWSPWLKEQMSSQDPELSQKTAIALKEIAKGSLVDETRDLAIYLRLGDVVPEIFGKGMIIQDKSIEGALEKFGINNIDEVKRILSMTGLEIINTSDRLSDYEAQSGYNSITEIDALLEAIDKARNKDFQNINNVG